MKWLKLIVDYCNADLGCSANGCWSNTKFTLSTITGNYDQK